MNHSRKSILSARTGFSRFATALSLKQVFGRLGVLVVAAAALAGLLSLSRAFAQTWTPTSAPVNSWNAIAISADGTKMAAVAAVSGGFGDGLIHTSSDSGATWAVSQAPPTNWYAIAMSGDSVKLVASGDAGVYTSADFGATWVMRTNLLLRSLASSADGSIVAGGWGTGWISIDSGATWTRSVTYASSFASSADGTKLVAAGFLGSIMTSPDAGLTWRFAYAPPGGMLANCLGSSADGSKLAIGVVACPCTGGQPGPIFASSDSGLTWAATTSPNLDWSTIASSVEGTRWVAAADGVGIYTSTDSATTWLLNFAPGFVRSVASSADGGKLVAAVYGGGIYVGESVPSPTLSISASGTNLLLSWTVPSMDFVLQQNSDLTTTNWADMGTAPTLNLTNLQNQVSVPVDATGGRYYRLKH